MGNDYFTGGMNIKPPTKNERESVMGANAPITKARKASGNAISWTVKHHAELLSVVLIVFAIFVVFTSEFKFEGAFWQNAISVETLLLATCSYVIYLNAYIIGGNVASRSDFTETIEKAYVGEVKKIREKKIEWMLELFCNDYRLNELRCARTEILLCTGLTERQIALILDGKSLAKEDLTEDQKKAIAKAKALKPIRLNKAMLVNSMSGHHERSPIRSASAIQFEKYRAFFIKLITIIVSFTFVVSLSIQLTSDFSLAMIIYALFQVVLLLVSLFGGMSLGYKIKIKYTERVQDIVGVLYEFWEWFDWREKQPKKSEASVEKTISE